MLNYYLFSMSTDNYELSGETLNRQIAELPVLLEDVKEKLKEVLDGFFCIS